MINVYDLSSLKYQDIKQIDWFDWLQDKIHDGDCIVIPLHSPDSVGEPILLAADMEPDSFIDIHLVKTPSKSLSLKSQDLTPASVIEVAATTAQYVEPVGKINQQPELRDEICRQSV